METARHDPTEAAETLPGRVDRLLGLHERRPLLATAGTRETITALSSRIHRLEQAVREIAVEVENRDRAG